MADGGITPDEYRAWQSPRVVVFELARTLRIDPSQVKTRILEGLAKGGVSAACYRAISRPFGLAGGESIEEFRCVPRTAWQSGFTPQEALWDSGDVRFDKFGLGNAFLIWDGPRECIGVRFDPVGIELLCEQLEAPAQRPPLRISRAPPPIRPLDVARRYNPRPVGTLEEVAPELTPYLARPMPAEDVPENVPPDLSIVVSAVEFDTWYAAQTPEVQAWGGLKLREKCSQDHGGRRVLKKATDHITKDRKTGRKPRSKNVPH